MAIEFDCPSCTNRLRVDDSSAGKHARCPACGNVAPVPSTPLTGENTVSTGGFSSQPPSKPADPAGSATNAGYSLGANSGAAGSGPAPVSVNPYSVDPRESQPSTGGQRRVAYGVADVKRRVVVPGLALGVIGVLEAGFMALGILGMIIEPEPNQEDFIGGLVVAIGVASHGLLLIVGGFQMARCRSYGLALTTCIVAVVPCCAWILTLPFGIWGIVVLVHENARDAFANNAS